MNRDQSNVRGGGSGPPFGKGIESAFREGAAPLAASCASV